MLLLLNGKILHALASIHHYCLSLKHLPCHAHTKFQDTDTITRWCVQWKTRDFTHTCLQKITNGNYLKNFCQYRWQERKKKRNLEQQLQSFFTITSSKSTFLATSLTIDKKAMPNSLVWPMLDWRYLSINFNFKKTSSTRHNDTNNVHGRSSGRSKICSLPKSFKTISNCKKRI